MASEDHKSGISVEVLDLAKNGDRKSQHFIYDRYAPTMYAICLRYATHEQEAEDMLQEGFIKAFIHLNQFRGEGNFEGWMRRIFVTTAIEHIRKRSFWQRMPEQEAGHLADSSLSAFDKLAVKDIMEMIQGLSDGYRTVFNLYIIEGYNHKEIAEMLNISEGTSKSQLSRAKLIMQRQFKDRYDRKRKASNPTSYDNHNLD